jgi:peptidoglycan/xylan/chitin deacetylase (PgdA/CDA1 family)
MKMSDRLLVLTYHAVDTRQSVISVAPRLFRRQMETLASLGITGISLKDAFQHRERTGSFPADAVVLTFDDGYLSVLDQALPIMHSFGFRGTAYIISGFVGLNAEQARNSNRYIDRDLLGWQQITEMVNCGIEIGSHTVDHPDLTRLDPQLCQRELSESREKLQQKLQVPVESFAYPFGFMNPAVCAAAGLHYRYACTALLGRNIPQLNPLQIHRVDVYYLRHAALFGRLMEGRLGVYLKCRHILREFKSIFR